FAAAEVAPYAKVGGLADVAGSVPQALGSLVHDVTVYMPYHRSIDAQKFGRPTAGARTHSIPYGAARARIEYPEISRDGVRTVFVRSVRIGRDKVYGYDDDAKRYALFCRAVVEDLVDTPPDVVHAHDWHAALLVPLAARARQLRKAATVFTIHNLAYQGRTSAAVLKLVGLPRARLPIEDRGEANLMARAIAAADIVSTVSERYAEEILTPEFGERLEGLLRKRRADLWGITNGIDTKLFDPAQDANIPAQYDADDQSGKPIDKAALQKETGLDVDAATPVFGVIGRLVYLRYGTIPVVRAVGGLATTVRDLDADPRGNGFSFTKYEAVAFSDAIARALHRYRAGGEPWRQLRTRAMREDHSWPAAAKRYVEMYAAAAKARRAAWEQ